MSQVLELKYGYSFIARAKSGYDAGAAYADLHRMLDEIQPDVETVLSVAGRQDIFACRAIERVRRGKVNPEVPYFRGSGIIVVGNSDGELLAASYEDRNDPVAEEYGNYQYVALRKTGLAAMAGKIGVLSGFSTTGYDKIQEVLEQNGLATPDTPHHLGYGLASLINTSQFMTAGASGMLPSTEIRRQTHDQNLERFAQDRQKGWYKWPGDEAAGLHDAVAAHSVLLRLTRSGKQFPHDVLRLSPSALENANIH